jgi:hypothetical protein
MDNIISQKSYFNTSFKVYPDGMVEVWKMKKGYQEKGTGGGKRGIQENKQKKQMYQYQASWRASSTVRQLVLANELRYLWTLTYKEQVDDRKQASRDFENFMRRLRRLVMQQLPYVAVMEIQQKRAAREGVEVIHFHMALDQNVHVDLVRQAWGHGFVFVSEHQGEKEKVASYLAKYLKKDGEQVRDEEEKRYFCSKALKRPQKGSCCLTEEQFNAMKGMASTVVGFDDSEWIQIKHSTPELSTGAPGKGAPVVNSCS